MSGASDGKSEEIEGIGRKAKFRILIFWVYEPMTTLRPRLDKRVDKMVEVITYFFTEKLIRVDLYRMDY